MAAGRGPPGRALSHRMRCGALRVELRNEATPALNGRGVHCTARGTAVGELEG